MVRPRVLRVVLVKKDSDPNSLTHSKHVYSKNQMFNPTGFLIKKRFWFNRRNAGKKDHSFSNEHFYEKSAFQQPMGLMI